MIAVNQMVRYLNTACGALIKLPFYTFRSEEEKTQPQNTTIPLLSIILLSTVHMFTCESRELVAVSLNHPMFLKVSNVKHGIGIDHICMQLRVFNPSVFTLIYYIQSLRQNYSTFRWETPTISFQTKHIWVTSVTVQRSKDISFRLDLKTW